MDLQVKLTMISAVLLTTAFPMTGAIAQQQVTAKPAQADADDDPSSASKAPVKGSAAKAHADDDDDEGQRIVVTGTRLATHDILGGVTTLDKQEILHDVRPSLGDTLSKMPGVTASSFGPSSSRPILRGLQGEDAPILIDGLTSLDLSASDPDHAVAINPLTAEALDVLRGPGALPYTFSVIGGVVNVSDSRIPRRMPNHVKADMLLTYGSAAKERSGNLSVDVPLGGHFVGHADGAYSKYDDLHVGGYLLSPALRSKALASPDAGVRALAGLKDKLPNTAGRSDDGAVGIAYVDGDTDIGLSYTHHDARYGVPIRFSLDPSIEPDAPTIDSHQDRGDARISVPLGGFIKSVQFRGGISKYHHSEIEPDGTVGTRFFSNGGEMRTNFVQADRNGWGGTSGFRYLGQDFRIVGAEKYLPDSLNRTLDLFTLQTLERGPLRLEAGARVDFARLSAHADPQIAANGGIIGTVPLKRSFTPVSAAIGGNYEIGGGLRLGLSLSHSERAPNVGELFSNGGHGGSQQFLEGDPGLGPQKSNNVELNLTRTTGPVHVQAGVYYSRYSNYLFEAPTGQVRDGLPVYQFSQGKANYYGFDVESEAKLGRALGIDWSSELVADATRAKIKGFGNAPQIPPLRVLGSIAGARGQVDGRLEVEHVTAQNKVAPEETRTPGYTMVNASLDWHPFAANPELTLSLAANNIFDVVARRHASDLKDYAPLAGRDIRLTARMSF